MAIFVSLIAVTILATPYVGNVMAGKGEDKLDFELYIVGLPNYSTGEITYTPDPVDGPIRHGRGVEWLPLDVLEVKIGDNTFTDAIDYSCKIYADYNSETFMGVQRVRETVTFYNIAGEQGTLEILVIGKLEKEGATFTGYGTGALEGVKVAGTTSGEIIPWPSPPYFRLELVRWGTVMGWPTL